MDIYHYHPETGEFLGQSVAIPDPLDKGNFLIPANSTEKQPPEPGQNEVAVFDGQLWALKSDFRGTVFWLGHGDKHTISEIGETVPEGAFLEEPEAPEPEPFVPEQVTRAQGKAVLIQAGLWQDVLDYVDTIEDATERQLAEVALHDTTHWRRDSPFLNAAAAALNITEQQMDALFQQAAEIEL